MQFIFALARPTIATSASRRLAGHVVATFKSLPAVLQMNKRETLLTEISKGRPYLIIVTDATDAVSVNFSGRCKFLQI